MKAPEYSIVIPVFNNQDTIEKLFADILSFFQEKGKSFEAIFIDDHSTDGSLIILQKLKNDYPEIIKVIQLIRNIGQHPATFEGFKQSRGTFVVTIDADCQIRPHEIDKLFEKQLIGDADLVIGFFDTDHYGLRRKIGSRIIDLIMIYGLKLGLMKGQKGSSFRLIHNELIQVALAIQEPIIFIDVVLLKNAKRVAFVKVFRQLRSGSGSGYTFFSLSSMAADLIAHYGRTSLKLIICSSFIGLLASIICLFVITIRSYDSYTAATKLAVIVVYLLSSLLLLPGFYLFAAICRNWLNRHSPQTLKIE